MAETVSKIVLDVARNNIMDFILAKQGDKASRFLEIELQNKGEKIEVAQTSKVYLNAEKPDRHITRTIGEVLSNGNVKVGLTNQTLAVDGTVTCDVSIETAESKLTSLKFTVKVEPCTAGDDVIVSTDEFTDLDEMVIRVDELETTVIANESDRIENETARQEAEVERVAENKRVETLINSFVGNMPIANMATPGAVKSGGDITVSSDGTVSILPALKKIYPIGTVQISMNSTNPSTYLGFGTWTQFAQGRTLVGVNTTDVDFNASGKTGGEKTHKITTAEMPSHIHKAFSRNWNAAERAIGSTADLAANYNAEIGGNNWGIQPTGGDQPHNNMQPYITVYFWQRTA